ncbi:hypothetical protein GEMRC1_006519 [Eukaryota sp. GEM-RC1]
MGFTYNMLLNPDIDFRTMCTNASEDTICRAVWTYFFLDISQAQMALHYCVSQSTISKWISKALDAASCPQSSDDNSRGKLSDEDIKYIIDILESDPLLYLREIVDLLDTKKEPK